MNAPQHTAGPWVSSPPAVNEWPNRPCVADINGGPSIYGATSADEGDVSADARLITAAPLMLQVLRQAREFVETELENRDAAGSGMSDYAEEANEMLGVITGVIALAEAMS